MAFTITRKGYWRLNVNGAFFSQHQVPDEGYERTSAILEADPTALVDLLPPRIELAAINPGAVPVEPLEPIVSDKGEDLIDFIARVAGYGQPSPDGDVMIGTGDLHRDIDALVERSRTKVLVTRLYADVDGDGVLEWIGLAWRGFGLEWWQRVKGAINVGVET